MGTEDKDGGPGMEGTEGEKLPPVTAHVSNKLNLNVAA